MEKRKIGQLLILTAFLANTVFLPAQQGAFVTGIGPAPAVSGSGLGDVLGAGSLTTAGRMVGVASSGNVTEYSDFIRTAAGRFQIYDSTGPSQLKLRGGSSQDTGPTSLIEMYSSANVLRASFDNIGQFSWIQSNGTTKSVTVGDVVRIGGTKGLYWSSSSGADGSLVLGLTRASDYNLGITNASSTTYWTIGAAGIQCGSGDGNSAACDVGTTGARVRNGNAAGFWSAPTYKFGTAGSIVSQSDGVWTAYDSAGTSFGRLQFGGTTNLFPAWKRSTTELQAKLADDSAFTKIRSSGVIVDGATSTNCLLADGTTGACGSGGSGTFQSTITDLKASVTTTGAANDTLNIAPGICMGSVKASTMTLQATAGSASGTWVAYCNDAGAVIVLHSTSAGLTVTQSGLLETQVSTPAMPTDGSAFEIASGTISGRAWTISTNHIDFTRRYRFPNGTGMAVSCVTGVCTMNVDDAVVQLKTDPLTTTSSVDLTTATSVKPFEHRTSDPTCSSTDGRVWYRTDSDVYKACANDAVVSLSGSGTAVAKNGVYLQIGSTDYLAHGMYAVTAPTTSGKSFLTNAGSASATTTSTGGALKLVLDSATTGWRPYGKSRGAVTKFTLALACPGYPAPGASLVTTNVCGMGFRDSSTSRMEGFRLEVFSNGVVYLSVSDYSNATTYNANVAINSLTAGSQLIYLQVEITSGTTAAYRYSPDGTNWTEIYSSSAYVATPDQFWVGGMADNTSGSTVLIYSWLEE